jgi:hypothetical protein
MSTPAWKSLPSWFLIAEGDQAIPPDAERQFAKRMDATAVEVGRPERMGCGGPYGEGPPQSRLSGRLGSAAGVGPQLEPGLGQPAPERVVHFTHADNGSRGLTPRRRHQGKRLALPAAQPAM